MPITSSKIIGKGFIVSAAAFLADTLWLERFFFETNTFYYPPATKESRNITVLQISDLHLQSVGYRLKRLINKINGAAPDLIVITGDAIDRAGKIRELHRFLQLINKDIQKVAILGNWEYQGKVDLDELIKVYAANNCKLLINETIQFAFRNKTLSVTGVDDYLCGLPDINRSIRALKKSDYHILLVHCPQYSDEIPLSLKKTAHIDFILSGHTHGGQINLFGFVPYVPRGSGGYLKGWYNDNPRLYVSKGIGTILFPLRFRARAELAIFHLAT
jgi:predicted MPP superfamily phosphohydrolase